MMFNSEFTEDVYELFRAYPYVVAYGPYQSQMNTDILQAFKMASNSEPDLSDFTELLRASRHRKDLVVRKAAWIAQRLFGGRAWSVGQRILKQKRAKDGSVRLASPLVTQLERIGHLSEAGWQRNVSKAAIDIAARQSQTLDVMVASSSQSHLTLVQAVSLRQVIKQSRNLILGSRVPSLFAPQDRPLANAIIPRRALECLMAANEVLSAAFPYVTIKNLIMIVDESESVWTFQTHLIPQDFHLLNGDEPVYVDSFDLQDSILSYVATTGSADVDLGRQLIAPSARYLEQLPIDRAVRPLMLLKALIEIQEANASQLAIVSGSELHRAVEIGFDACFDRDMRRHDFEDCLQKAGWIQSPRRQSSKFYVTASGIALSKYIEQRFLGPNHMIGTSAIGLMERQARLVMEYRRRMAH